MGEVCSLERGARVTRRELAETGSYPVMSGGVKPMGYLETFNREADTITIAQYGTAGFVSWVDTRFWANDVCYCIIPKQEAELNKRYLLYLLLSRQDEIDAMVNREATPWHLPRQSLAALSLPVPPMEIQEESVQILDSFVELEVELEAELKARHKQYAYYRDRLLTHKEKNA